MLTKDRISRTAGAGAAQRGPGRRGTALSSPPRAPARSTGRLQISIVIPARNEQDRITACLEHVRAGSPHEVIVVDGQSTDRTRQIARKHGAQVLLSPPGRARQMNRGAATATGNVLLFLHADTLLPSDYAGHVRTALSDHAAIAGAFGLRLDRRTPSLRLLERFVNWRARFLRLPYGDQALFLGASTFRGLGGFADLAVMEDFELVRRLGRRGRIHICSESVITSARRWSRHGVWRTTLLNQLCIAAFAARVAPDRIARWREELRFMPDGGDWRERCGGRRGARRAP